MKRKINKKVASLILSAAFVITMAGSSMTSMNAMASETVEVEAVPESAETWVPTEETPVVVEETPAVSEETPAASEESTLVPEETPVEVVPASETSTQEAEEIQETEVTEEAETVLASTYDTYKVNTTLYMRKDADKTSTAIAILKTGVVVTVKEDTKIANGDLWGKIEYNGKTGWISLKYCTKQTTGTQTIHDGVVTTTTEATTVTTTETTVSTTEASGETTTATQVDTTEVTTTATTESTTETTAAPATTKTFVYKVTASTLNVRSGAGTSYSIIGSLSNGTQVTVTEVSSNNWGKISYNGKTGWISLTYASKISENTVTVTTTSEQTTTTTTEGTKATTAAAASSSKKYIVTASSLNVRSGSDTTYTIIGTLSYGSEVTVTEVSSNNWGKISYNGQVGWISLTYCQETTDEGTTTTPTTGDSGWQYVNGTYCWYSNGTSTFASNSMYYAWSKIKSLSSATSYYIVVNCSTCQVFIFYGSRNNWVPYKLWACSPGAYSSPTVKGKFTVGDRGYSFGHYGSYTCYYWTQFYGNYLFHSVLYYWNSSTIKDGRLGMNLSAGCVRLDINNAKWIYNNIPTGTQVYVY